MFTRSLPPWTGACSNSASSTIRVSPFGVRAPRCVTMSGFSAATSRRAASFTAPGSPTGGEVIVSFGVGIAPSGSGFFCSSESTTSTTGPIGGVIAIL